MLRSFNNTDRISTSRASWLPILDEEYTFHILQQQLGQLEAGHLGSLFLSTVRSDNLIMWSRKALDIFSSRKTNRVRTSNTTMAQKPTANAATTKPSASAFSRPLVQTITEDARNTINRTKRMAQEASSSSMRYIKYDGEFPLHFHPTSASLHLF